jgi:hypothetical protein
MPGALFSPPNPDFRASWRSKLDGVGGNRRGGKPGAGSSAAPLDCTSCPEGRREGSCGADCASAAFGRDGKDGKLSRDEEDEDEDAVSLPRKDDIFVLKPFLKPKPVRDDDLDSELGGGLKSARSSFGRLGGSAGSSVSPHAGALMRPLPLELTDVVEAPRTLVAAVECDTSDVTDSVEGLRGGSVGLRGGSAGRTSGRAGVGGGWRSDLRVGKGGGAFLGFTSGFGDGVGGCRGTGLDVRSPAGSFPIDTPSRTEPVTL